MQYINILIDTSAGHLVEEVTDLRTTELVLSLARNLYARTSRISIALLIPVSIYAAISWTM